MIEISYSENKNKAIINGDLNDPHLEDLCSVFSVNLLNNKVSIPWNQLIGKIEEIDFLNSRGADIIFVENTKSILENSKLNRQLFNSPRPEISSKELNKTLKAKGFKRNLFDFQSRNVLQLITMNSGASFSVPGAGKTTEALAFFTYLKEKNEKLFIICPKNVFLAWKEEIQNKEGCFNGSNQCAIIDVTSKSFDSVIQDNIDFYVMNYHMAVKYENDIINYFKKNTITLIIDESHYIKGINSQKTQTILNFSNLAKHKLILSGTPIPNNINEFKPQVNFLIPEISIYDDDTLIKYVEKLYVRTVRKELNIPKEIINSISVPMSRSQKIIYDLLKNQIKNFAVYRNENVQKLKKTFILIIQLLSNSFLIIERLNQIPGITNNSRILNNLTSPKITMAIKMARDFASKNKKTIIWSSFIKNIEIIHEALEDIGSSVIYGNTSSDDREKAVYNFNNNPNSKVIIINPAAGSEGISLHKNCHTSIYVDTTYNSVHWLQSMDRIRRIGQINIPEIYVLRHDHTLDKHIEERLNDKVQLMEKIFNDYSIMNNLNYLSAANEIDDEDDFEFGIEEEIDSIIKAIEEEQLEDYAL